MLPVEMMAVEITEPGGPKVLRVGTRPVPVVSRGEVLIQVVAAGINGADLAQRRGVYPPPPSASDIPGLEVSGTIVALGSDTNGFAIGDPVCALLEGGGYAEYCTAPATQVLPLPTGIDYIAGAGLMETLATVWANVFQTARLAPGETLLVHGGGSGIGTTAIQLAKLHGARVVATAGNDAKTQACTDLGADLAINYRTADFLEILKAHPLGGVDVVLDIVGGPYLARNVRVLKPDGRLVFIAFGGGRSGELDIARVMINGLTVTGSTLRNRSRQEKATLVSDLRVKVWPLVEAGLLRAIISKVFPLAEAATAHRFLESGAHFGKVILSIDPASKA